MRVQFPEPVILLGYDENEFNGKTYHAVQVFDQASSEPISMSLDAAPNGNAVPPGTPVLIEAEAEHRRSVVTKGDGKSFVGRAVTVRYRVLSMKAAAAAAARS